MLDEMVAYRRAVEALRAGIPSRDVVRLLPPTQADVPHAFEALLHATSDGWLTGNPARGLLVEGDFGTGKSHCLEGLRHRALERNFVCSNVVLSKETPLHDLLKVYRACVATAVAPDARHQPRPALREITGTYHAGNSPHLAQLEEWLDQGCEWGDRFAATLHLFRNTDDEEMQQRVLSEWAGYPMLIGDLRAGLRAQGYPARIAAATRMPVLHRFEFLSRFFRSAGYAGWVLLLDETEMVSRYSTRQRGRAYAHLAQLLGRDGDFRVPGLAGVFTITKDYPGTMLLADGRNDLERVPDCLAGTRDESLLTAAGLGMGAILREGTELRPATPAQVDETYTRVRALYSRAYAWEAPDIEERMEFSSSTGMRQYIRSWINTWDLRRLYDHKASVIAESVRLSYEEDTDMQEETPDEDNA